MKPKCCAVHSVLEFLNSAAGRCSTMLIRSTALGAASALLLLAGLATGQAGPASNETKVAEAAPSQVHPVAAVERDDDASCSRARRRLWIEGEGWVVRRITTCR
jgi:hypothetical protein